jgi:hypothetical protein
MTNISHSGNGEQQTSATPGYSGVVLLDESRSLLKYIVFGFLTCGIYPLYILHRISKDVNVACEGDGKETAGLLKLVIFSTLSCGIYAIYWYYSVAERVYQNAPRYDLRIVENGGTFLLWYIIGFCVCGVGSLFAINMLLKNVNAVCAAYNRKNRL